MNIKSLLLDIQSYFKKTLFVGSVQHDNLDTSVFLNQNVSHFFCPWSQFLFTYHLNQTIYAKKYIGNGGLREEEKYVNEYRTPWGIDILLPFGLVV